MQGAQLSIDDAIAAGEVGMSTSLAHAEGKDPQFSEKAKAAILAHLQVVQKCSGEDLTDIARAKGAVAPDDRAFGGVFQSLIRANRILVVGYAPRRKGNGCIGAKVYALVH